MQGWLLAQFVLYCGPDTRPGMNPYRKTFCIPVLFTTALLLATQASHAQSLILGIPNADVAHKGVLEITHESQVGISKPVSWNSFNILTYGLNKRIELTANLINLDKSVLPGATFAFGGKYVLPLDSSAQEWKLTAGTNLGYAPRIDYERWGVFSYSHLSMRLPRLRTRLTGGVSYGTPHFFGFRYVPLQGETRLQRESVPRFSLMAGIEQPLTQHLSLVADWFSGNQAQGALIAGFQYDWGPQALLMAYKVPNGDAAKDAVVLEAVFDIDFAKASGASEAADHAR